MTDTNNTSNKEVLPRFTHIVLANSKDGTQGFTLDSKAKDRLYVGLRTDYSYEDSTNPKDYSWYYIPSITGTKDIGIGTEPGISADFVYSKPSAKKKRVPKWLQRG